MQNGTALNQLQSVSSSWFLRNERHNVGPNCIFIANLISVEGKTPSENPSFFLKRQKGGGYQYFSLKSRPKEQQTISCVMLPFAGRNIGLPRKLKGPRHVFHLHNGIRGVTCSSHTNELMTRDKKETRGFAWTWRWMFLLQSLYPLNWLLVCFHSVSFSLLVYLRWVIPQKESAYLYPIYTPFPICSCTEDTAGAFNAPQIGPFTSISLT